MEKVIDSKVSDFKRVRFVYRWWYRVIVWLSAGAVFITTYFLMLPALTVNDVPGTKDILGHNITGDKLRVNNVYPIHAVLGEDGGWKNSGQQEGLYNNRTNEIVTNEYVKTIWIQPTCNLGNYFYGANNTNNVTVGTTTLDEIKAMSGAHHIDLDDWCAIRVEYNTYYQSFFVAQVVYGGNDETIYDSASGYADRIKNVAVQSGTGFILLVRKSFLDAGNLSPEGTPMRMYIPSCDGSPNDWEGTGGKTVNHEIFYEVHDKVHLNEAPLKAKGDSQTSLQYIGGYRPGGSISIKENDSFGYITFSPYIDQNDVANAVALAGDVPAENLAQNITFKLFDYSIHINKRTSELSLFNTSKTIANDCVLVAEYFNFRNKEHTNEDFKAFWGNYAACMCGSTTGHSGCEGESGHKSILHRNNIFDADGFTEDHLIVWYRLEDGDPAIYLKENAKGEVGNRTSGTAISNTLSITDRDLGYLFDIKKAQQYVTDGKLAAGAVTQYNPTNTILQYNPNTSTYSYDSAKNAVDYSSTANKFYVRGYTERNDDSAQIDVDMTNYYDFLPFNYGKGIVTETYSDYTSGFESTLRDSSFNRKKIYYDNGKKTKYDNVNYWFGMTMEFSFIQGKDGKVTYIDSNGNTQSDVMKFTFSGDDDVWVFIDGVKVLELGGTHGEATGEINFSTGEIKQYLSWNGGDETNTATSFPTNLKDCFTKAYRENSVEWNEDGTTFADYTMHDLKFYYLERGASVANCSIEFNLQSFNNKSLIVGKDLVSNGSDSDMLANLQAMHEFQYRVLKADKSTLLIDEGATFKILENNIEIGTGTVGANGLFTLKHGQQAIFENIWELTDGENAGIVNYYVEEIMPTNQTDQYSSRTEYSINSGTKTNTTRNNYTNGTRGYISGELTNAETQTIIFTNYIDESKLRDLSISKEVEKYPSGSGTGSFDVQVKLDGELLPVGMVYYVEGTTETRTVVTEGVVTVNAGETIIIKGILDGTTYEVEELASSILPGFVVFYNNELKTSDSGTIDSANVIVAILNKQSGDNVQITVNKTLENVTENSDFDFTFTLKGLYKNSNNIFVEKDEDPHNLNVTISGNASGGTGNATFTLQYLAKDYEVGDTYCYYKITETIGEVSIIDYDGCAYVVTVKVSKSAAGELTAEIDSILKYSDGDINGTGTEVYDGNIGAVNFVNKLILYSLPTTGGSGEKLSASQFVIGYVLILAAIVGLLCCVAFKNKRKD